MNHYNPHASGNLTIKTPKGTMVSTLTEQEEFYWKDSEAINKSGEFFPNYVDVCANIIAESISWAKRFYPSLNKIIIENGNREILYSGNVE